MKPTVTQLGTFAASLLLPVSAIAQAPVAPAPAAAAAPTTFTITVRPPVNGTVTIDPALPADGKVAPGTVFTVKATPAPGYAIDSVFYSIPGQIGRAHV